VSGRSNNSAEIARLEAILRHLKVGKKWKGIASVQAVVDACEEKVHGLLDGLEPRGEFFSQKIAQELQVKFEEVHDDADINTLEDVYLRGKGEIGFAMVRQEIQSPNVDALLFQRTNAQRDEPDRWVAVLNLTVTKDRAYWNRYHEIAHRLAEPPQYLLPFRRQLISERSEVEDLMDAIAGRLAFHPKIFSPHFDQFLAEPLTFELVQKTNLLYAPSASLLSVMNALVDQWNRPALAFVARMKPKRGESPTAACLRVEPQARNEKARETGFLLFGNMRVPIASCIHDVFHSGIAVTNQENASDWTTSSGKKVGSFGVTVSAMRLGPRVYGIMTL
jgi:hypothetical protein